MNLPIRGRALALPLLLLAAELGARHPAPAQGLPRVLVTMQLPDRRYHELTRPESAAVALSGAGLLARRLGGSLRFAEFVAGGAADDTLTFTLDRLERAATGPDELWLYASVAGAGVAGGEARWFRFQQAVDYNAGRPRPDVLVRDLDTRIKLQDLAPVAELLSRVPLSRQAAVRLAPPGPGWVMPFRHRDLCIDRRSTFLVRNRIAFDAGSAQDIEIAADASATVDDRILAVANRDRPDDLDKLRRAGAGRVQVLGVYVTRYQQDPLICQAAITPTDAGLQAGGAHP